VLYKQLFDNIDSLLSQKERLLVAIDGNSGAGKSSLASSLKDAYSCNVISTDSFFLMPNQRTPERLSEPGGNIDYERFFSEVITPLISKEAFFYRHYNCKTMELTELVEVKQLPLTLIEGVYSMHPKFLSDISYDISVFMRITGKKQLRRLEERNPKLLERFKREWIPMENQYFDHFGVANKCDLVFEI
jgi:uridine kinase